MTPLIRVNPAGFKVPVEMDQKIMARCLPGREKDVDDSDRVGCLFLKECLGASGGGAEVLRNAIWTIQKEEGLSFNQGTGLSQRLGNASWWAHLMLRLKGDPIDITVFSLEDLGFTDPKIFERATVADLLHQADRLGLKPCPIPLMAAIVLWNPKVSRGTSIVVVTDPVDLHIGYIPQHRATMGQDLKYWAVEGRDGTKPTLHRVNADPRCRIVAMEEEKIAFGCYSSGEINIPSPARLGFMFVVPRGFRLPPPPRSQLVIETIQSSITLLADMKQKVEVPILSLPDSSDGCELISTASAMQEAVLA
jgi:hypothetical protein